MSEQQQQEKAVDEAALRASVNAEVFDGKSAEAHSPVDDTTVETKVEVTKEAAAPEEKPDVWAGVTPALKQQFEGLQEKVKQLDPLSTRLRQAETRLGHFENEAKKAAAAKATQAAGGDAPSSAQIDAAVGDDDMQALKDLWPEWYEKYEKVLAKQSQSHAAERDKLLAEIKQGGEWKGHVESQAAEIHELRNAMVNQAHKGWGEMVKTKEFHDWWTAKGKPDAKSPDEVIAVLDAYQEETKSRKAASDIARQRAKRLEDHSTNPQGTKVKAARSDDEMTDAEIRAAVAKEVYASG